MILLINSLFTNGLSNQAEVAGLFIYSIWITVKLGDSELFCQSKFVPLMSDCSLLEVDLSNQNGQICHGKI